MFKRSDNKIKIKSCSLLVKIDNISFKSNFQINIRKHLNNCNLLIENPTYVKNTWIRSQCINPYKQRIWCSHWYSSLLWDWNLLKILFDSIKLVLLKTMKPAFRVILNIHDSLIKSIIRKWFPSFWGIWPNKDQHYNSLVQISEVITYNIEDFNHFFYPFLYSQLLWIFFSCFKKQKQSRSYLK